VPSKIVIPLVFSDQRIIFNPKAKEDASSNSLSNLDIKDDRLTFSSKKLTYNLKSMKYDLNFSGMVNMSSCKNFQLILDSSSNNDIKLQFGKISDSKYHLGVKYPFSPLQAFCIALTKFDVR